MTNPIEGDFPRRQDFEALENAASWLISMLTPQQSQDITERSIKPNLEALRQRITNENIASSLMQLKKDCQNRREATSRPNLCANFIAERSSALHRMSVRRMLGGRYLEFAVWYCLAQGVSSCAALIYAAENGIKTGVDLHARQIVAALPSESTSLAAQAYLAVEGSIERSSGLLKKDPTGVSLVEDAARQLKDHGTNQFTVLGAEFGAELYRRAYRIAEASNI